VAYRVGDRVAARHSMAAEPAKPPVRRGEVGIIVRVTTIWEGEYLYSIMFERPTSELVFIHGVSDRDVIP
jgi:hypothetical protein